MGLQEPDVDRPMRVLYFYQYFTTPSGSWSTRVYEMARRWVCSGDHVTVVTSVYDKSDLRPTRILERFDVEGIEVVVLNIKLSNKHGVLMRLYTFAVYALLASWYALRHPADVVVSSSGPITVGIPGLIARFVARRPFVFEVRDLWPEGAIQLGFLRNRLMIRLARWFEHVCYRAADVVVPLSPGQADWVRRIASGVRTVTVPNASDIELVERAGRLSEVPSWTDGKRIVLYAGTLGLIHGCQDILDAAAVVQMKGRDDVVFVLIGDGNERTKLEDYARERNLNNVKFLGLHSKEHVMQWHRRALGVNLKELVLLFFTARNDMGLSGDVVDGVVAGYR